MEIGKVYELFEKHDEEFLKFERVENKLSKRPDLHAFILLDKLTNHFPGNIIAGAEHDEIYLDVDIEEIDLTENDIIDLIRCGVLIDEDNDSFKMFV